MALGLLSTALGIGKAASSFIKNRDQEIPEVDPVALQKAGVAGNLDQLGKINKLAKGFSDQFVKASTRGAKKVGINLKDLSKQINRDAFAVQDAGDLLLDSGRGLIDGSFFNTAVGKQSLDNIQRSIAPRLSVGGRDAFSSTFGGAASRGETDTVTAFLRNAISERDKGFEITQRGATVRDAAAARRGGLLGAGMNFGIRAGDIGANVGASQLTTPSNQIAAAGSNQGTAFNVGQLNAASQVARGQSTSGSLEEVISQLGDVHRKRSEAGKTGTLTKIGNVLFGIS